MNIGDFKAFIAKNNLPDDMPLLLWDGTTDKMDDMTYQLGKDALFVEDIYENECGEAGKLLGKALYIGFENKLNENPI